ncbi:cytochrome c oxidase assembly protein [Chthonobacter rhizosphaerae]|uniref:cytochrome c oxidase assembly protein n=1 Tax=Chthonobacter rhizosphaerae TaxID=2735553 RepID=UPI0015EE7826
MKRVALIAGLVVLAAVWGGPLLTRDGESFAAHMIAHMGVVAVAAPLIAVGLAGGPADPSARWPAVFAPVPISLAELVVVWGWHAPAARAFADGSAAALVLEQASFLLVGLALWFSCVGHRAGEGPKRAAAGAFGLLLTSVHMTLLGALLALTPRPLYGEGVVTCLGLTLEAVDDQTIGGVVMLLVGAAVYLAGGVGLMRRLLADGEPDRPAAEAAVLTGRRP